MLSLLVGIAITYISFSIYNSYSEQDGYIKYMNKHYPEEMKLYKSIDYKTVIPDKEHQFIIGYYKYRRIVVAQCSKILKAEPEELIEEYGISVRTADGEEQYWAIDYDLIALPEYEEYLAEAKLRARERNGLPLHQSVYGYINIPHNEFLYGKTITLYLEVKVIYAQLLNPTIYEDYTATIKNSLDFRVADSNQIKAYNIYDDERYMWYGRKDWAEIFRYIGIAITVISAICFMYGLNDL